MSTYDKVADLPVVIEAYGLRPLRQDIPGGLVRHTTVISFQGQGQEGLGEDVTYDPDDQLAFQKNGPSLVFSGSYTLKTFADYVIKQELFKAPPQQEAFRNYRRWALESAALSLALQQANKSLAEVLGLNSQPVNFVASRGLGKPASIGVLRQWLEAYPKLRFKLDPTNDWDDELIADVAKTGAVETLDFKGHYKGTPVDVETDPELYRKLLAAFPEAWIEDADVNAETKALLEPHAKRLTLDAPLHSVADIGEMAFMPEMINVKPSRFGSLQELFNVYDYCRQNNIGMYGGGQFELGPGRQQIQYLASLFHPTGPNDVAPREYNSAEPQPGFPASPLSVEDVF